MTTTAGHWGALGTGFPIVAIWQLDLEGVPAHQACLAAGTHGRGAFTIADRRDRSRARGLQGRRRHAGRQVEQGDYTLTVKNIGNAAATGVTITDPVPANTSFVSAQDGGRTRPTGNVTWSGLTVPAGGSVTVHFTVSIADR